VRGVDWGSDERNLELRYEKMAAVIEPASAPDPAPSLLDVGCGFGGFHSYLARTGREVVYTGIDLVPAMIAHAGRTFADATWIVGDIFEFDPTHRFDYVVCNGILTQKLAATITEMDAFAEGLILKLFALCSRGVAFNVMSTKVSYMSDNLYYKSPVELLAWCLADVTPRVRIDHLYPPLHEYTMYLGRTGTTA
jgi:SAM-dependent methyltransferase